MTKSTEVLILLAAYNGAKFISEQIESIRDQTVSEWTLWIRDDGSTDDTAIIIQDYCKKDARIKLIVDQEKNLGACGNFLKLMTKAHEASKSSYIALADQDDVWLPNKLELLLSEIKRMEHYHPVDPILVHSNLSVVAEDLSIYRRSQHTKVIHRMNDICLPHRLLIQNIVTGCTTMFNRKLLDKCIPFPESIFMHDWWLALVAGFFGKTGYICEPLVLYRQHADNCLGVESRNLEKGFFSLFVKLKVALDRKQLMTDISQSVVMANAILARYLHSLDSKQKSLLFLVADLNEQGFLEKRINIFKNDLFRPYLVGNIALVLRL